MAGNPEQIEIPKRALFKPAEVCELVKVQPYVLRSWETEFPALGVAKTAGGPRVYRRADIEQVLRIKHLLLVEGLTLAGARRKLEEESAPVIAEALDELFGRNARDRITEVKRGLRAILDLLSGRPSVTSVGAANASSLAPVRAVASPPARSAARSRADSTRAKRTSPRQSAVARRKRPA
jgi:DNA-binding transcriptional MerR regulator